MADWNNPLAKTPGWVGEISNRPAKEAVAQQLAARLEPGDVVGVGSGSTAFLGLEACAARAAAEGFSFTAIPTSLETEQSCVAFGRASLPDAATSSSRRQNLQIHAKRIM